MVRKGEPIRKDYFVHLEKKSEIEEKKRKSFESEKKKKRNCMWINARLRA
jgi:hypothetical protein